MISTTGTSIESYLNWVKRELETKEWGEVSISFKVCSGQVTDVTKGSFDSDHFPLKKANR
jgi:hypothetical protein